MKKDGRWSRPLSAREGDRVYVSTCPPAAHCFVPSRWIDKFMEVQRPVSSDMVR